MPTTRNKIDQMSTADWRHYHQLLSNQHLMTKFMNEVRRFSLSRMKPDDVLRRFSLNGDGFLDLREFQLAMTRLEIVSPLSSSSSSSSNESYHQQIHPHDQSFNRAKELYVVFCPSQTRKLDIDLFCRIMTEWSLELMRTRLPRDSTSHLPAHLSSLTIDPSVPNYSSPYAPLATPYATQATLHATRFTDNEDRRTSEDKTIPTDRNVRLTESEILWQRLSMAIVPNREKLRQIFLKMDLKSSGTIYPEELELALSHIGVFLTTREYDKLYMSFEADVKELRCNEEDGANNRHWRARGGHGSAFVLHYAKFLALFHDKTGISALPSKSKHASPPVMADGSARLWALLVAALDKLMRRLKPYERIGQTELVPETFRESLLQCGITLSNADFAALRVRLLPYSDPASGSIQISSLLQALKAADHTAMQSKACLENSSGSVSDVHRHGRKMVSPMAYSSVRSGHSPIPAGKSTQERNAEESRTIVKVRDDRRRESELHFPTATTSPRGAANNCQESEAYREHQDRRHDPFSSTSKAPPALERRILAKMQQLKQLGHLAASSVQSVFPGDRFGRISRGQFRQSLAHLNLLARYADVEALFWTLDPQGQGFILAQDLYRRLHDCTSQSNRLDVSQELQKSTTERLPLARSVQKLLEQMLSELPRLVSLCERIDTSQSGYISTVEMRQVMHELGLIGSMEDIQAAIEALCPQYPQATAEIPYSALEARLSALCSALLSPKKSKNHLSSTSVLMSPSEEHGSVQNSRSFYDDAMPRRRLHQDHRAARSSIQLESERMHSDLATSSIRPVQDVGRDHRHRIVGLLQDLLERRSDLKTALALHRHANVRGQINKHDLVDILLSSRLNLHFPGGASAAHEVVNMLFPSLSPEKSLDFLTILRRSNDLLSDVTKNLSFESRFSQNLDLPALERQAGRRLNPDLSMSSSVLPMTTGSFTKVATNDETLATSCAQTVRRKLLEESRLKDLLRSEYGQQSAAVLVRHAFKGLAPRERVVPIDSGEFDATCRACDIKHVCSRLGLELDLSEQHFVVSRIDVDDGGFVSSPELLTFFRNLAQHDESILSSKRDDDPTASMRCSVTTSCTANRDRDGR